MLERLARCSLLLVMACTKAWAQNDGPILDLGAAIRQAAPGATLLVPAGRYAAPVVIDKPLVLLADGAALIDACGQDDAVRITAPDVTLRGFQIRGSGDNLDRENAGIVVSAPRATIEDNRLDDVLLGVLLNNAHDTVLARNTIQGKPLDPGRRGDGVRLWNSHRCRIEGNTVVGARDVVVWYSQNTHIVANTVRDGRYGLHFMYANGSLLERNQLTDNSVGVFLMYSRDIVLRGNVLAHNRGPSGYGLGLKDMDDVLVEDNVIAANRAGIYIDNSPQRIDSTGAFRRNLLAFNDIGLALLPAVQRNRFSENAFVENVEQVAILGSGNLRNNEFVAHGRGNYWSDYAGFDADGDGVGDAPYRAVSLFENLIDREPALRLFLYSPAQQAVELASRAFPIVQPAPKISDAAPLMRLTAAAALPVQAATTWPLASISAGLMALAGLLTARLPRRGRNESRAPVEATSPALAQALAAVAEDGLSIAPTAAPAPATDHDPALLEISGLRKSFGRQVALDDVSLRVAAGQAVALWGANGAGKTTLLKCILGLHASRGAIRVAGLDARRSGKAARRHVGYVAQQSGFHDDLSAIETTRLFAALQRVPRERAAQVLRQVGLEAQATKRVAQLSGGMKQRLALAVALLADPPILLLDEPTSSLDAAARGSFFELLVRLKADGKTIVFTTHRAAEAAQLADRVVVLERGRVIRDAAPGSLNRDCHWRISIPAASRTAAQALLRRAGYEVHANCTTLRVRVPAARNAEPIVHLVRAGFHVSSVEFERGEDE